MQVSGSEGRPDSPSDSLDDTKKGERKKEFVCQVLLLLSFFFSTSSFSFSSFYFSSSPWSFLFNLASSQPSVARPAVALL